MTDFYSQNRCVCSTRSHGPLLCAFSLSFHFNTPVNVRAQIDVDIHTRYHDEKCIMLYSNVDSFLNKRSEFLTLIDERKPKIIALTEIIAKHKQDFHLAEYELPGYDLLVNKDPAGRCRICYQAP